MSAVTLQQFGAGSRVQPARAGFKSSSAAPAGQPGVPCHPFPLHLLRLPGLLVPALASPRAAFPHASLLLYPWPAMLLAQWGSFSRNVHFCMKYRPQGGKKWDIDLVPYVETLEQSPPNPPPSTLVRSLSPPCHRIQNHLPNVFQACLHCPKSRPTQALTAHCTGLTSLRLASRLRGSVGMTPGRQRSASCHQFTFP